MTTPTPDKPPVPGPKFALQHKPVNIIEERFFSQFVSDTYGRPYKVQQQDDCKPQDTIIWFEAGTEPIWLEDTPTFAEWLAAEPPAPPGHPDYSNGEHTRWHREYYPQLEYVVQDLFERGYITKGNYGLWVWW